MSDDSIADRRVPELKWAGASAALSSVMREPNFELSFMGFRRRNMRPGTRNDLWVIPTNRACAGEARMICEQYRAPYWMDAVRVLECIDGSDSASRLAASIARNPNAAGVLFVGMEARDGADVIRSMGYEGVTKRIKSAQVSNGACAIWEKLDELAADAPRVRERFPLTDLRVGVVCADLDCAVSSSVAPLMSALSDSLTASGAAVITADLTLFAPLADVFASRIADRRVFERYADHTRSAPIAALRGEADALTADTKAALCALEHTGTSLVTRFIAPGEISSSEGGVQAAASPPSLPARASALVAAGAQVMIITSHSGTPYASPIPTIKAVPDDVVLAARSSWSTLSASSSTVESMIDALLSIASGELLQQERDGSWDIYMRWGE